MSLNPSQQKAVDCHQKHLLIVAGPGTGKTYTLTQRMIKTIDQLKDSQKILALTFTQKAALEMAKRLKDQNGPEDRVEVNTFHSFCLKFLHQFHFKDFRIVDLETDADLFKALWPELSILKIKKKLREVSCQKTLGNIDEDVERYNTFLHSRKMFDYDDLLYETRDLLEQKNILSDVCHKYPFIFVDEYQDINALQHQLLKKMTGLHGYITAIGDPNQAIYGFRGSDVGFFETFLKDFPRAETIYLSTNYRSTANIVEASSQLIRSSRFVVPEITAHIYSEGRLVTYEAATDKSEAEYVIKQIEMMVGGTSMFSHDSRRVEPQAVAERSFGDIAILYRLNCLRKPLEDVLNRSGIPYSVSGEKALENKDFVDLHPEKVSLLTMHAAKGLEFPVVFVVGCEEGLMPLCLEGFETDQEEERRLFYVAITRAKEELYLTCCKKRMVFGKSIESSWSSFINDIEDNLKYRDETIFKKRLKEKAKQLNLFEN
jgi:DNA helicase-2/ATP-dependent DNA helicase PcrA